MLGHLATDDLSLWGVQHYTAGYAELIHELKITYFDAFLNCSVIVTLFKHSSLPALHSDPPRYSSIYFISSQSIAVKFKTTSLERLFTRRRCVRNSDLCTQRARRGSREAPSNINEADLSTEGDTAAPTQGPKNPAHPSCQRSEDALSPQQSQHQCLDLRESAGSVSEV